MLLYQYTNHRDRSAAHQPRRLTGRASSVVTRESEVAQMAISKKAAPAKKAAPTKKAAPKKDTKK